jgi:hypothetical protein
MINSEISPIAVITIQNDEKRIYNIMRIVIDAVLSKAHLPDPGLSVVVLLHGLYPDHKVSIQEVADAMRYHFQTIITRKVKFLLCANMENYARDIALEVTPLRPTDEVFIVGSLDDSLIEKYIEVTALATDDKIHPTFIAYEK